MFDALIAYDTAAFVSVATVVLGTDRPGRGHQFVVGRAVRRDLHRREPERE